MIPKEEPSVVGKTSCYRKCLHILYMGVSENRGTPKWMVYRENPTKRDDLGVPLFSGTSISIYPSRRRWSWSDPNLQNSCLQPPWSPLVAMITARRPVALVVHRFCGHFSSCSSLPWDDQDLRSLFCSFLTQIVALLSSETGQWNVWSSVISNNSPQNLVSSLHDRQYSWQAPLFFNIQ